MKTDFIVTTSAISQFLPHAIILTEFSVPRPIFAAALIRADKFKRIDFSPNSNPISYVRQTLKRLPKGVPCFGKTIGFIINYEPEKAVQFDKAGNAVSLLTKAHMCYGAQVRVS